MHAIVLFSILAAFQVQEEIPILRPGEIIQETIEDGDPFVHTEILDKNYTQAPTVGKRFIIKIVEPGPYTIEMKALFFDTYLVLRGNEGSILAEDDDGLYGTHSRIKFESKDGEKAYYLDACALHGERGDYTLCLAKGDLPELSPLEKGSAALRDSREMVRIIEAREGEESPALAAVLNRTARLLFLQGNYNEAKPLFEHALRIFEQALCPEHPETATVLNNLAWLHTKQGNYGEARSFWERLLALHEEVFGPKASKTVKTLKCLGNLYCIQGKYEEALPFYERVLEIREHTLDPEHPDTVQSLQNLAYVLSDLHRYEEARPLYERVLAITEKVCGPDHPETALSLNWLGWLLVSQGHRDHIIGKFEEAKPLFERALRILEKRLGPKNPDTAMTLNNLGSVHKALWDLEKARSLYERALEIREAVLGPEHPETVNSMSYLARLLVDMRHYKEAIALYERALRISEETLGPEHPDTAEIVDRLGHLHYTLGSDEKIPGELDIARPLLERALRIRENKFGNDNYATAISLNNVAGILAAEKKYEEARLLYERAFCIMERLFGPEHIKTVEFLTSLAYMLKDEGNYKEARALSERAFQIWEKTPDHVIDIAKRPLTTLGSLLYELDKTKEALKILQRALRIHEKILGPEHLLNLGILSRLGMAHLKMADYEEAKPLFTRALQITEKKHGSEHPLTAEALYNLSLLFSVQCNDEEAWPLIERTLRIEEKVLGPEDPKTAMTLKQMANMLFFRGDYGEAYTLFKRALRILEKVKGLESIETAFVLMDMADMYLHLGNYAEVHPLSKRALRTLEKAKGPEHPLVASALQLMAESIAHQGNKEEALTLLKRALRINEKAFGADDFKNGEILQHMSSILWQQGQMTEAKRLTERTFRIFEKALGPEHPRTAISYYDLAMHHASKGEHEAAREFFEKTQLIGRKKFGRPYWKLGSLSSLVWTLINLERFEEAWDLSIQTNALYESEYQGDLYSLSEHERLLYAARLGHNTDALIWLAEKLSSREARRFAYEKVLHWKGLISRSMLESEEHLARSLTPEAKGVLARLRRIQSDLSKTLYTSEVHDPDAHEKQLNNLLDRRKELEIKLFDQIGGIEEIEAYSLADLFSALPDDSAIVDFFIHRQYKPEGNELGGGIQPHHFPIHVSVWVLRKEGERLVHLDLGPVEPIQKAVAAFLDALVSPRATSHEDIEGPTPLQAANERLHALVWKPTAGLVQGAKTVFISPDTFLGEVPFEAIQDGDGTFLIERHAFAYHQDMGSFVRLAGQAKARGNPNEPRALPSLLVVGNVDYQHRGGLAWLKNKEMESPEGMPDENTFNLLARSDVQRSFSSSWGSLPGTEQESMTIIKLHETVFEDKADRLMLRGTAATEERLKAELPGFNLVHLATHGFFNPEGLPSMWEQAQREADMPMRLDPERKRLTGLLPGFLSGLVLSGVASPPDQGREDGFMTAEELTWLDLSRVRLVVLSACETGLGTSIEAGEGLIGLNRSLRQAGAEAVISSLWKVDDHATQQMFAEFYRHLWIDKMSAAEALRQAKLDMLHGKLVPQKEGKERGFEKPIRKAKDYSHPYYWASFVYWGAADQP